MVVAAVARWTGSVLQLGLETAVALALGLAVGAATSVRAAVLPGATLAARYALRLGITLLGARLTLGQLLSTGAGSVVAIVIVVVTALVLGTWLARRLGLVPPLSALITVGMAICGNSAILALSPIIGAKHRDTAYAVSTITIFGLIGVLLLPVSVGCSVSTTPSSARGPGWPSTTRPRSSRPATPTRPRRATSPRSSS